MSAASSSLLEKMVVTILRADTGVGALIGTGTACRVYVGHLRQGADLPAVSLERVYTAEMTTHGGSSSLFTASLDVTCVGTTAASASDVAAACHTALANLRAVPVSGLGIITSSEHLQTFDETRDPVDGSDAPRYMRVLRIEFMFHAA